MSSSCHSLRLATAEETRYQWAPETHLRCTAGKCREPAVYVSRYWYVSGKAGRHTYAERLLCPPHAKKFAVAHAIELPLPELVL